jgi:peroxiredoxin
MKALGTNIDSVYFVRLRERDSCLTGSIAPNFKATSVDGQKIELSKLKGQVVFLNFWFTRCQPCIQEMPALNKLVKYYSGKKVRFISFAPEESSAVLKFLQKRPFNFTAIANSENIRKDTFKLFSAWPYSIIIDRQGRIAKIWFSNPGEGVLDFYKKIIDNLLK